MQIFTSRAPSNGYGVFSVLSEDQLVNGVDMRQALPILVKILLLKPQTF